MIAINGAPQPHRPGMYAPQKRKTANVGEKLKSHGLSKGR
jgi:hypothetical protein